MRSRAAVLLALAACGTAAPSVTVTPAATSGATAAPERAPAAALPPAGVRAATAQELRVVAALMRETEQLRGLRFRAEVRVTIENRAAMRAYVLRAIDDAQLARARRRYLALGALDPALDVRALLVDVMEEELIGYYDPEEKRLAVRTDVAAALGEADRDAEAQHTSFRATVVHELVHALQDQHFSLAHTLAQTRTTDAENAFGALVEGDATLVMLGYLAARGGTSAHDVMTAPEQVRRMMARPTAQLTGALQRAPALLREPLLFRYRDGATFCATLMHDAGWTAVDAAHRAPPKTTRAVHDPRAFVPHEAPTLPVPDAAWLGAHALRLHDNDVLGALETSVLLDAPHVRGTWRSDRYLVLETGHGDASLWWLQLASPAAARTALAALEALGDPMRQIAHRGSTLVIARGLDAQQFQSALAWTDAREATLQDRAPDPSIGLPLPRASTRQAPPFSNPRERARDAIAD